MKKIILIFVIALAPKIFADDCQITIEGKANSGYAQGKRATVVKWYSNVQENQCEDTALDMLRKDRIQYTQSRNWTSKHRLSPTSTSHYIVPNKATWCIGEIPLHRFWFKTEQENCTTIDQQER